MEVKMIKKFSVRKILITTLLLLVAIILYNFPKELEQNIEDVQYNKINIYLIIFPKNLILNLNYFQDTSHL